MRVRYEMYENGVGVGYQAICDLSTGKANKLFDELSRNGCCGWVELVGEDDENYMEVIKSSEHIDLAKRVSLQFGKLEV